MSALRSEFRCEECNTFFAMICPVGWCKERACGNERCDDYTTVCHQHCDDRGNYSTLLVIKQPAPAPKLACCGDAHIRAGIKHSKCYKAEECLCGPCECDCHYLKGGEK